LCGLSECARSGQRDQQRGSNACALRAAGKAVHVIVHSGIIVTVWSRLLRVPSGDFRGRKYRSEAQIFLAYSFCAVATAQWSIAEIF
jgi:hypothetical protein